MTHPGATRRSGRYGVLGEEARGGIRRRAIAEVVIPCGEALCWRGEAYASSMRNREHRAVSGRGLHPRRQRGFGGGIDEPQRKSTTGITSGASPTQAAWPWHSSGSTDTRWRRGRLQRFRRRRPAPRRLPCGGGSDPTRLLRSHHEPLEVRPTIGSPPARTRAARRMARMALICSSANALPRHLWRPPPNGMYAKSRWSSSRGGAKRSGSKRPGSRNSTGSGARPSARRGPRCPSG